MINLRLARGGLWMAQDGSGLICGWLRVESKQVER